MAIKTLKTVTAKNLLTGMAGVYSVAAELSLRGFVVAVTSRNAPGVDLLAFSRDPRKTAGIQVKANRSGGTQSFWLLTKRSKQDVSDTLFYVFVNLKGAGKPAEYYIVPSRVVARKMGVSRRPTSTWYWFYRDQKYRDKWETITDNF
jgi:hypothetical protein